MRHLHARPTHFIASSQRRYSELIPLLLKDAFFSIMVVVL
ncbi:hypothetical protein SLEP1_g39029 [Rubroshorea leprosula]|uniref:Uncharacterized protein n=1 Tax=Rubroshorea leprosula TaxID=152421 RepID=A0AAV5KZA3_9ROSI|nr:hypothetical protein SLEP1_g39029 [Rubroshorea leprosula]